MNNFNNTQHTAGASNRTPACAFVWNYEENARLVDERRHQQFLQQKAHYDSVHKTAEPTPPESARTELQLELFKTSPQSYDLVERLISNLPRSRQREYFRKLYLKTYRSVKDDGSIAFKMGNIQRRTANIFLRDILEDRLQKVFKCYRINVSYLVAFGRNLPQWKQDLEHEIRNELVVVEPSPLIKIVEERLKQAEIEGELESELSEEEKSCRLLKNEERYSRAERQKSSLPFYLITEKKLEEIARMIATAFEQELISFMYELAPQAEEIGTQGVRDAFLTLYERLGKICHEIGFPAPSWEMKKSRLTGEKLDIALRKIACEKYWLRVMTRTQKRMIEHVAIACGEVRKHASTYISFDGFRSHQTQIRKNFDYLKSMVVENIDNPEEQLELIDMFRGSSSNPDVRRFEMMNRLNGLEQWAEREEHEALFLTLTAPSSFHATHSTGDFNKKWEGASPRHTQAYLNKVWQQYRALLAKRKIKFYGMRVAEPHHDGTPHWHLLVYVKAEHKDDVIQLFKKKALEQDGTERGALKHRCKVEECDKEKGSATAYIAKYISKNINGFALDGETSDENPNLSLKDNAQRVRAWASIWGIRQFQFYGGASISVWRELRRLVSGQADDEIIEKARACADVSCFASYIEIQGGAMAMRKDQPIKLNYIETDENKYGESRKKIQGVENKISFKTVVTRLKKWAIKRRPVSHSETQESTHSVPWTCVSNCNRLEVEQKIKNAVAPIRLPLAQSQIEYLMSGKPLLLNDRAKIQVVNDDVVITDPLKERVERESAGKSHLDRLREIPVFFN
ncbi:replication endonuclease [Pasteurella sp. PK-2025]|uniref:replication endonuclease n=1 Tax=Pasteurella sp. PK-2025 TaxID=3413133 RepID=UPI003C7376D3